MVASEPTAAGSLSHETDVLIVGSGPTGLMAATLLARCGVRVRIVDKTDQQAHESRAFGVQAKSLELFLNIGIADEFLNRGLIAARGTGLSRRQTGCRAEFRRYRQAGYALLVLAHGAAVGHRSHPGR